MLEKSTHRVASIELQSVTFQPALDTSANVSHEVTKREDY